ncbi:MAG: prephenate dehydrogenase [Lentisphaeraceae bacterium]|nr:prephenate dehydrogenase [Lentisphaeraceae bacterium]
MMSDHIKMPEKICIVGLGQMGGSIAKALKAKNDSIHVTGWARSQSYIDDALKNNYIDSGSTDIVEAVKDADFSILALPVEPLIDFVKVHADKFKAGSIVTDVSSVKSIIVEEVRPIFNEKGIHFIGSHPMAGNEKSGLANACENLYEKTVLFICSYSTDDPAAINIVREFWRELGTTPYEVDAIEHDEAVSCTSHTLHLTSAISTQVALGNEKYDLTKLACAGAFRDMSRISGSCPKMWRDITKTNKAAILKTIDKTVEEIEAVKKIIESDDWNKLEDYLDEAKVLRNQWWADHQEMKK